MASPVSPGRTYRVREFAALAGVTVRTLHYYDRVGLLKPRRTRASYRVYSDSDLPRLQQIVVLKFLGLPLSEIAAALKSTSRFDAALKSQRFTVKRKRAYLDAVQHMLDELEAPSRNWTDLASCVRELTPFRPREGSTERQKLDEALRLVGERRKALDVTLEEYELNRDLRLAIARGDTPDTEAGRALVARWRAAINRFVGGDPALRDALAVVTQRRRPASDPAYHAFFDRAIHSRQQS